MAQAMLKNCPVCGKSAVETCRPFCSARCANIDLGRWLGEHYRMPTEETPQVGGAITVNEEDAS